MNNKGYTLIELLAVIVVMSVISLIAVTQVLPLLSSSKEAAFALNVNNIGESGRYAKSIDNLEGPNTYSCYSIDYLVDSEYLKDNIKENFDGVVLINPDGKYVVHLIDNINGFKTIHNISDSTATSEDIFASDNTATVFATCADAGASYIEKVMP